MYFFSACKKDVVYQVIENNLIVDHSIDVYPDSTFFTDIRAMQYADGYVYALDAKRADVSRMNIDFGDFRTIGQKGEGPGELIGPVNFYVTDNIVYIQDMGRYKMYTTGNKFIKKMEIEYNQAFKPFFYFNNQLFVPFVTNATTTTFQAYNITEMTARNGGYIKQSNVATPTFIKNRRSLIKGGNCFYSISDNIPVIEKYDLTTLQRIDTFDISGIPIIKENLNFIARRTFELNESYSYVNDCCLYENFLYLLCSHRDEDGYHINTILKFNLNPDFKLIEILHLPDRIYNCFCISQDYLFAFSYTQSSIGRFKLPDLDEK